jgi:hypothetical protein
MAGFELHAIESVVIMGFIFATMYETRTPFEEMLQACLGSNILYFYTWDISLNRLYLKREFLDRI